MILYEDGGDCCGKTWLCNKFHELMGSGHYTHLTYRWKQHMHTYHYAGLRHVIRKAPHYPVVTLDRGWMSEDVYARVYRKGSEVPMSGRILQKLMLMHNVQTIICSASPEEAERRHAKSKGERVEMYDSGNGKVAELYNLAWNGDYHWTQNRTYMDLIIQNGGFKTDKNYHYYTIGDDPVKLLDRIVHQWLSVQGNIQHFSVGGHSLRAKLLLIGDCVNYSRPERTGPFMAHKNSSLLLARAIHSLGILEPDICYYNVNDSFEPLEELLKKFGKNVIVMGKLAQKTLIDIDPSNGQYCCIPHPSWACRFSNVEDYASKLHDAIDHLNLHII